ncbi:Mitochondrial presequence protease [Elasticomyces elasticus]|nr:Mitochondrial presequence protease [Elasticomyces elasticus]
MSSYRDPNPKNSLATFQKAGAFARDKAWSEREIEESKLSVFQGVDAPRSVSSEGSKEFMYGITQDMDAAMRERLLGVTKDHVQKVAEKYLVNVKDDDVSTAILGEKKPWVEEDQKWKVKSLQRSRREAKSGFVIDDYQPSVGRFNSET